MVIINIISDLLNVNLERRLQGGAGGNDWTGQNRAVVLQMTNFSPPFLKIATSSLLIVGLLAGSALANQEGWLSDFEAAKKLAAEKNLDILMNFTGSDW